MSTEPWQSPAATGIAAAMLRSLAALTGQNPTGIALTSATDDEAAAAAYATEAGLLCHDGAADPLFTYGNLTSQRLFELDWYELVGMPSRLSAEADEREERTRMLAQAAQHGYFSGYAGVRISSTGKRFRISDATIWTVTDRDGAFLGQAAIIGAWSPLP